jgi:hypothetical protein
MAMACPGLEISQLRWLGFDLDHTLVRYRLGPHVRLIFRLLVDHVCSSSTGSGSSSISSGGGGGGSAPYPISYQREELLGGEPSSDAFFERHAPHVLCKGLYFDYGTGDLLKLDGKGYVCAARHGLLLQPDGGAAGAGALLSAAQLRTRYGRRPWRHFEAVREGRGGGGGDYAAFAENFDVAAALLCARLVDMSDIMHDQAAAGRRGRPPSAGPRYSFGPALRRAFEAMYAPEHFADGTGGYFSALRSDPTRYIEARPGVAAWCVRTEWHGTGTPTHQCAVSSP